MKESIATLFFADLMNSTELAKNLTLLEYDEMLVDFQDTIYEVVTHHLESFGYEGSGSDSEWSLVGDEVRVIIAPAKSYKIPPYYALARRALP